MSLAIPEGYTNLMLPRETRMSQVGHLESINSLRWNARVAGRVNACSLFAREIDGKSLWARKYRDRVFGYVDDAGGVHALSELPISLIRRAEALTVEAKRLEVDLASGREMALARRHRGAARRRTREEARRRVNHPQDPPCGSRQPFPGLPGATETAE